jgi:hypothetical protein
MGRGAPARYVVPPGTRLWRVHDQDVPGNDLDGVIHVAERSGTTLAEYLSARAGLVRPRRLDTMMLSSVRTTAELFLARVLDRQDELAIGWADGDPRADRIHRLHAETPDVAGVVWSSRHDLPNPTMALFGDRCPVGVLRGEPGAGVLLGTRAGVNRLNSELAAHGVRVPMPVESAPLVFVNYRGSDERHLVDLLDEELCARLGPSAVFRDDRSIGVGTPFDEELLRMVRACAVLLVVIGERWDSTYDQAGGRLLDRESDWVRREIAEALDCDVWLVPLLVGARGWPTEADLPEGIKPLARRQYVHLQRGYRREHVRAVVDRVINDVPRLRAQA